MQEKHPSPPTIGWRCRKEGRKLRKEGRKYVKEGRTEVKEGGTDDKEGGKEVKEGREYVKEGRKKVSNFRKGRSLEDGDVSRRIIKCSSFFVLFFSSSPSILSRC